MANAIMIALGKAGKGKSKDEPSSPDLEGHDDGEEGHADDDEIEAAKEFKDAMKNGDDETLAIAFKNFMSICKGY